MANEAEQSGVVFDIQHFSVHDGPGIRTNVFLKGCPIRCRWCSNPESQSPAPQVTYEERLCIGCGECAVRCPHGAARLEEGGARIDLVRCGECVGHDCLRGCYARALKLVGERMTAAEAIARALRDRGFYKDGGGVTFTGGEPFAQPAFLLELLTEAKKHGLNTAIETCLCAEWDAVGPCVPLIDVFLCDVKHVDAAKLREYTGADWGLVRDNLSRLASEGAHIVARVPVVGGFNDSEPEIAAIARFVASLGVTEMHLLPYHALGKAKYAKLDRVYSLDGVSPPDRETMSRLLEAVRAAGLKGMLNG